jgi:hypothetical protein
MAANSLGDEGGMGISVTRPQASRATRTDSRQKSAKAAP